MIAVRDKRVFLRADADDHKKILAYGDTVYYGGPAVSSGSNDGNLTNGQDVTLTTGKWFVSAGRTNLEVEDLETDFHDLRVTGDLTVTGTSSLEIEVSTADYSDDGSFQPAAYDLNLAAAAGTSTQGDTSFLAAIMGNILGAALTKTHNFVAGVIGALNVTGTNASTLQKGGVLGIVGDGVTVADGAVVGVIDGSDPSSATHANAIFAGRMNNNHADSGVDYGLDLYDPGQDTTLYSGGGLPLAIDKADVRMSNQVCILNGAGAPVDGTTGDNFAGPGSLYVDITNKFLYIQTGTISAPTWVKVGTQS